MDTYISSKHKYLLNGKWTTPEKEQLLQKWKSNKLIYYHIKTENYKRDILVVNGLEMETWNGKYPRDIKHNNKKQLLYKHKLYKKLKLNNSYK